jgi:alkaline phosphatase D
VARADCRERVAPDRTFLGLQQEQWLHAALDKSTARWNIIAQQTLMAQNARPPADNPGYWTDGWDGYPHARARLLDFIAARKVGNPLVVGGDIHTAVVADLKRDFDDARSPVIASEVVGTSITSQGANERVAERALQNNPHLKYFNGTQRGYTAFEVGTQRCAVRLRMLSDVKDPEATIADAARFVIANGRAGVQRD